MIPQFLLLKVLSKYVCVEIMHELNNMVVKKNVFKQTC